MQSPYIEYRTVVALAIMKIFDLIGDSRYKEPLDYLLTFICCEAKSAVPGKPTRLDRRSALAKRNHLSH